jgi:hypothetical protein
VFVMGELGLSLLREIDTCKFIECSAGTAYQVEYDAPRKMKTHHSWQKRVVVVIDVSLEKTCKETTVQTDTTRCVRPAAQREGKTWTYTQTSTRKETIAIPAPPSTLMSTYSERSSVQPSLVIGFVVFLGLFVALFLRRFLSIARHNVLSR